MALESGMVDRKHTDPSSTRVKHKKCVRTSDVETRRIT